MDSSACIIFDTYIMLKLLAMFGFPQNTDFLSLSWIIIYTQNGGLCWFGELEV